MYSLFLISIFLLEFVYRSLGIDVLLFAGEEGMAGGADFHLDLGDGRTGGEGVAAGAGHLAFYILGVNAFFHLDLRTNFTTSKPCCQMKIGRNRGEFGWD